MNKRVFFTSLLPFFFLVALVLVSSMGSPLDAAYILRYSTTTNGAMTFTGNALGLSKATNQNNPGTNGSIGAFMAITPAADSPVNSPVGPPGPYPTVPNATYPNATPGTTTLIWQMNSSSAVLDIPAGSTVLYAELAWSGGYGFNGEITSNEPDSPITLITPDGQTHTIVPDPSTSQPAVTAGGSGYYTRSANVTAYVATGGTYTAGGIPAGVAAADNTRNAAGWTLAVVYQNTSIPINNLTLFVGNEGAGAPPSQVTGFCTPASGSLSPARLMVSAIEGDSSPTGDQMKFGPTAADLVPNTGLYVLSGPNNPPTNFFTSAINDNNGNIDRRGTYGDYNVTDTPLPPFFRQGYDITNVDVSGTLTNNQQQAFAQGTTTGDTYTINALGLQIPVNAPFVSISETVNLTQAVLGDTLVYTVVITNTGTADVANAVLTTVLSDGLTFISSTPAPTNISDQTIQISVGPIPFGGSVTVTYRARIDAYPQDPYEGMFTGYDIFNNSTLNYNYPSCPNGTTVELSITTNTVSTHLPGADIQTFKTTASTSGLSTGQQVTYTITATNLGPDTAQNVIIFDNTPAGTGYVSNDGGASGVAVGSSGTLTFPAIASLAPSASVSYQVTVTAPLTPGTPFTNTTSSTSSSYDANQSNNDGTNPAANVTLATTLAAIPDTGTTPANTILNVPNPGVLANDFGTGLRVISNTQPANGSASVSSRGGYTYIPNGNFSGIDTFTYLIKDVNNNTSRTTVTITVTPTSLPQSIITNANQEVITSAASGVLAGSAGSNLTVTSYTQPVVYGSSVIINADGSYTYTPAFGASGPDSFTFTATDSSGLITTNTVSITILPISEPDIGSTMQNIPLNGESVLNNDFGTGLSATLTSPPSSGTIILNADGTYLYTPNLNFVGTDSFSYTATDIYNQMTTNTVTITVVSTPVYTNPDFGRTFVNTPLVQTKSIFSNDSPGLTLFSYTQPANGQVIVDSNGLYVYTPNQGFTGVDFFTYIGVDVNNNQTNPTKVLILVQPVQIRLTPDTATTRANIPLLGASVLRNDTGANLQVTSYTQPTFGVVAMTLGGKYLYIPPRGFSGIVKFTYTVTDAYSQTASTTVTINVIPKAFNETVTTPVNTPLTGNLLTNDLGSGLTVTNYQQPAHGTVIIQPNGAYTYTPTSDYSGPDSFMYTVTDSSGQSSTATVNISVTPLAVNESFVTETNIPINGSLLSNDMGSDLTVTGFTQPSHGSVSINPDGTFTYIPNTGYAGPDSFTYTVIDSSGQTSVAKVSIKVNPVPPPINFTGVLEKCVFLNKTDYRLQMQWGAASSPNIVAYRIYSNNNFISQIPANGPLVFSTCLKSKQAATGYNITAVNSGNAESSHLPIRIIYE